MQQDITLLQRGTTTFHLRRGWEDIAHGLPLPALWAQRRGEALAFRARSGTVRAKRKCRGGFLAPLFPNLYSHSTIDALLSRYSEAVRRDLPTARLVGIVSEPRGSVVARLAVITEEIPSAESLAQRLTAGRVSESDLLDLGREVRSLHRAGLVHGDLNATNVIRPSHGHSYCFLDLDDARYAAGPVPDAASQREIIRLARSIAKVLDSAGIASPSPRVFARALFTGYVGEPGLLVNGLDHRWASAVRMRRVFW